MEIGGGTDLVADLIDSGSRIGARMITALTNLRSPVWLSSPLHRHSKSCGCRIPPPCWEPQPLGTVASRACPAGTARLRIRITNCGSSTRTMQVKFGNQNSGRSIAPESLTLGPLERDYVVASLEVPVAAEEGDEIESLLWIDGCRRHYVRWRVRVGENCPDRCPTVDVEDCPDPVHRWYDHFYCERPCPQPRRAD